MDLLIEQVWNKSLSQLEIQQYMSCPPLGNETGLVGFWNFNEGSGNVLTDLANNEIMELLMEQLGQLILQMNIAIIVLQQMIL